MKALALQKVFMELLGKNIFFSATFFTALAKGGILVAAMLRCGVSLCHPLFFCLWYDNEHVDTIDRI